MKREYDTEDDIAALATPRAVGAIAVIRTSGKRCLEKAARCFSRPKALKAAEGGTFLYGKILHPTTKEPIDDVIVSVSRAPRSYTGGDCLEISCHGGIPGVDAVLAALREVGFRDAEPGEFTMRAFINGKLDLTQAEAVASLIDAKTKAMHTASLRTLDGAVSRELSEIRRILIDVSAAVEVQLDYAEDDLDDAVVVPVAELEEAALRLRRLSDSYKVGRLMREGVKIALAGRTNSGKSSLFNRLLNEERSIVSDIHGTTRDYLEESVTIAGFPVVLYDTAGLRRSDDRIEAEGIERAHRILDACDLVLYVVNAVDGETDEDRRRLERIRTPILKVINKIDLKAPPAGFNGIPVSAATGEGLSGLIEALADRMKSEAGTSEPPFAVNERQSQLVRQALTAVEAALADNGGAVLDGIAIELKEALDAVGELTGETASPDILDAVFSRFCVGK